MDVELASAGIGALIERRAGERSAANEREDLWRRSAARHDAKIRELHRAEWQDFYLRLAASLRASADQYDQRAEALREGKGGRWPGADGDREARG